MNCAFLPSILYIHSVITNPEYYASRKIGLKASDNLTLDQKYAILDGLYREALLLGHFTKEDILLGIEDDIRLAALLHLNVRITPRKNSTGA